MFLNRAKRIPICYQFTVTRFANHSCWPCRAMQVRYRWIWVLPSLCRCSPATLYAASSASTAATNRASCSSRQCSGCGAVSVWHFVIPLSSLLQTSNNIIQKGLAFVGEQSGSVTVSGRDALGILPRRLQGRGGAAVGDAASTQWRISMAKLTDTQLVILSTASRRNDRGVDLPGNVTV